MDVTDPESVGRGMAKIGHARPATIVVNNSGVTATRAALDLDPEEWDRIMDTNLKGAWLVARAAARQLIDAKLAGSIINVASILGFRVAGHVAPYAASKAALVQLTHAGAGVGALPDPGQCDRARLHRNRPEPRVLRLRSSTTLIARIPQRRLGRLEDLDGPLLLLAADASAYMTGSAIVVDGGHLQSTLWEHRIGGACDDRRPAGDQPLSRLR